MGKWSTDPWSIAACYISNTNFIHTSGSEHKKSSKDLECAELLSLFVNNEKYLKNTKFGVFDTARRHRNELMHNAKYEISHEKLSEYLKDFKDVLEVKDNSNETVFTHDEVRQALKAISDLQNYQIYIDIREEIENMKRDIRAKAMVESTKTLELAYSQNQLLRERLNEETNKTMVIMCEKHDGTVSTWLCIDHATSFCKSCMEKEHRKCSGLRKRSERHTYYKPVSIVVKKSLNLGDRIETICALPNGEYLIQFVGMFGFQLCKVNKTFHAIASCVLPRFETANMCYVGNNKVAFNLSDYQLLFINVKNLHFLKQKVTLREEVQHLTCHGDKIYAFNGRTVFSYTIDETDIVRPLCVLPECTIVYKNMGTSITVSDNGDFIYCTNESGHVYKVDSSDGNVLLKLKLNTLHKESVSRLFKSDIDWINLDSPVDVCYLGNCTVIVCDGEGHVIQIKSNGDYSMTEIVGMEKNSFSSKKIYDRSTSSLIVVDGDVIKIFRVI